ncbi:MAG: hypothetical protein JRK53_10460 [Deltaproteobacteria bacterium]|nr:hypothetical protein [Deltaproteobacteria bacterium]
MQTTGTVKGSLTYSWSPSNGWLSSTTSPSPTATPTNCNSSSITYTVVVTDDGANSCTASDQVKLKICCNPGADAGPDQKICAGDTAMLGAETNGVANGAYTYSWSPGNFLDSTTAAHPIASPSSTLPSNTTITYTVVVTATGCNSCTDSDEMVLTVCAKPEADAGEDQEVCAGESVLIGPGSSLVNGNYTYKWSPPEDLDDPSLKNPMVTTSADSSSMTVTYTVVWTELDCNSCTDSDQMVLTINENPNCAILVDGSDTLDTVQPGSTHTASVAASGGATYDWTVENGVIESGQGTNMITWKAPDSPTTIKISIMVTDTNECECEYDPPIDVVPPGGSTGILKVLRFIPTLAGGCLIGLVALLAGTGAWVVRKRKRQ